MPPRLVMGDHEWYILLRYEQKGKMVRRRPTFNLNRISNLLERERRGQELAHKINWWFQEGRDILKFDEREVPAISIVDIRPEKWDTLVVEAINFAMEIKCTSDRVDTNRTYRSICNLFNEFIQLKGWESTRVGDLQKEHALAYMDHCTIDRKVGSRTWNNNLRDIRIIFNFLVDRGYLPVNPFSGIRYKKNPKKKRRAFTRNEAQAIIREVAVNDRLLFYGIILQYAFMVRPSELRRLRFQNVNVQPGLVYVGEDEEKTHREKYCTIPDQFKPFFEEKFWSDYPAHFLIFGAGWAPHPSKACGEREMNRRHRQILVDLKNRSIIKDISGLSWYSWKDTGITDVILNVGADPARAQANHSTEEMTRRYYHAPKLDKRMKDFKSDLF